MFKKLLNKVKEIDREMGIDERSDELYAVAGLFDTPDEIMNAAEKVSSAGYKEMDVHTPYPVHGMDDAMKLKSTKLGFFSFAMGFVGTCLALLMIGWMSGIDYPSIVGGKPFFTIPPAIPITFEVTVLLAALTTVGVMLVVLNKLPWNNNPLMDTDYMKSVSVDKFGIIIKADDPKFDKAEVENLFKELGSSNISLINKFKHRESNTKTPVLAPKFLGVLVIVAVIVAGGTYFTLNWVTFQVPFNFMWEQKKITPQQPSAFFKDGFSMRTPPEGTVMRDFLPYEYKGLPDSMVKYLANPLPVTEKTMKRGQERYEIYCSPCHGYRGEGDAVRLNGQFPNPPSFHTDKVRNWPDGNIYHVISNGQNIMPSYASQIPREDRWAIIHYIRALQRSQNATDEDVSQGDGSSTKTDTTKKDTPVQQDTASKQDTAGK